MSSAERKTKVDRCHDLPISRQCEVLAISRSSAYRAPAGLSAEELDLMRKLDELHLRYPWHLYLMSHISITTKYNEHMLPVDECS